MSTSSKPLPRIALTPGEPAGIGPDILLALIQEPLPCQPVAFADPELLQGRARRLGLPLSLQPFDAGAPAQPHTPGTLWIEARPLAAPVTTGRLDARNAPYVLDCLAAATEACLDGRLQALVTGPIQKSVINEAGIAFSGHTEFLAERTGTAQVVMMLASPRLRVALLTTHVPLAAVPALVTADRLQRVLRILHASLHGTFGIDRPRILVLGLNPHAGEGGHLGREEIDTIVPALAALRAEGMDLHGPLPADTAFTPDNLAGCDAVLAMYHDQGLPVLKAQGFGEGINITLGLPIIRTSVDHGTALPLAGSGQARPDSLRHALHSAVTLTRQRRHA